MKKIKKKVLRPSTKSKAKITIIVTVGRKFFYIKPFASETIHHFIHWVASLIYNEFLIHIHIFIQSFYRGYQVSWHPHPYICLKNTLGDYNTLGELDLNLFVILVAQERDVIYIYLYYYKNMNINVN